MRNKSENYMVWAREKKKKENYAVYFLSLVVSWAPYSSFIWLQLARSDLKCKV